MNKQLISGLIQGLSAIASIYVPTKYSEINIQKNVSSRDAMRSDWKKVGLDFKSAMDKFNGETTKI